MTKLPKWPVLLVKGKRITPEQADVVIIRTTMLQLLSSNDEKWDRYVKQAFGIRENVKLSQVSYAAWDEMTVRLGGMDLEYLPNARISTHNVSGPYGWCNWDGTIGTNGMNLMSKWPEVGEIHEEWGNIAAAFPYLDLTAQLVHEQWDHNTGAVTGHVPLVTWTVARGAVEMHDEPGGLIRPVREDEDTDTVVRRMMRRDAEIGVHYKRLTRAVRRAENATRKGK
jgi:hypothetical protein